MFGALTMKATRPRCRCRRRRPAYGHRCDLGRVKLSRLKFHRSPGAVEFLLGEGATLLNARLGLIATMREAAATLRADGLDDDEVVALILAAERPDDLPAARWCRAYSFETCLSLA